MASYNFRPFDTYYNTNNYYTPPPPKTTVAKYKPAPTGLNLTAPKNDPLKTNTPTMTSKPGPAPAPKINPPPTPAPKLQSQKMEEDIAKSKQIAAKYAPPPPTPKPPEKPRFAAGKLSQTDSRDLKMLRGDRYLEQKRVEVFQDERGVRSTKTSYDENINLYEPPKEREQAPLPKADPKKKRKPLTRGVKSSVKGRVSGSLTVGGTGGKSALTISPTRSLGLPT